MRAARLVIIALIKVRAAARIRCEQARVVNLQIDLLLMAAVCVRSLARGRSDASIKVGRPWSN